MPWPFQVNCLTNMTMMNISNRKLTGKKNADIHYSIPFPILKEANESTWTILLRSTNQLRTALALNKNPSYVSLLCYCVNYLNEKE